MAERSLALLALSWGRLTEDKALLAMNLLIEVVSIARVKAVTAGAAASVADVHTHRARPIQMFLRIRPSG